jgi:hypothetical protein
VNDLTTQQLIVLGIIFGVGLLIGFLLKPGGAKWRRRYNEEHAALLRLRDEYERAVANAVPSATTVERQTLATGSF